MTGRHIFNPKSPEHKIEELVLGADLGYDYTTATDSLRRSRSTTPDSANPEHRLALDIVILGITYNRVAKTGIGTDSLLADEIGRIMRQATEEGIDPRKINGHAKFLLDQAKDKPTSALDPWTLLHDYDDSAEVD